MKKALLLTIFISLLSLPSKLFAQQDAQFSQYMFNGFFLNPGYSGIEGVTRFSLIHRTQWLGYEPTDYKGIAPSTQIFSATTKLPGNYGGTGMYFLVDRLGPIRNIDFELSYAYHLKLSSGTLGLGLRGGFYSQSLNTTYYRVDDESDPIYQYFQSNPKVSQLKGDFTAGVWYDANKKYYAGLSFSHIPQGKFNLGFSDSIVSKLVNHMYITGGYNFDLGTTIKLTPSALIQTDMNELTYLFGALATYNSKIWVGLNFRQSFAKRDESKGGKTLSNDDVILYVGINLLKNSKGEDALRLGYAFDFVTSGVNAKKRTSHEVLLSYMMPTPWALPNPKVRTPRYRHEEN